MNWNLLPDENTKSVYGNSTKFREWLTEKGIEWKPNGQHTSLVDYTGDVFMLGHEWGIYEAMNNPKYKTQC